ncbi:MAG: sulfatase-like hydrolase/transferase [Planctomycetes bacterium]|nr:sulfatase-like hydrolase/transferase [Planctomycetota bacterium]
MNPMNSTANRATLAVALLLAVATVAVATWHAQLLQFFCDDSYISYRYSENFAAGKGLVWNEGERVEGYTNFLWVILVGAGMKAGFGAEPVSLALGLLFLAIALVASARLTWKLTGSLAFAAVPPLLLVCQGPMILWSVSGLEASCYAAMTLLAVLAYERWFHSARGLLLAGALFGLSTMVRPDGVIFGGAAGLHLVLCGLFARPLQIGPLVRRALALACGFVLLFGPFVLWRHSYYQDWLPNTFYIKAGGALNLRLGINYLLTWASEYPLAAALTVVSLVATLLLPRFRAERRTYAHLALALTLFCGYLAWAGGDYMALYRFLVPLLPLAMVPAAALLQALFEGAGRLGLPAPARAVVGLALLASGGYALLQPTHESIAGVEKSRAIATVWRMKRNSSQWELLGKALHAKFGESPTPPTIAITAAGAVPFFSKLPTIDQSGLCDRHTAKVDSDPWLLDRPGHMKQATRAYLAQRRPEIIFWHPQLFPAGKAAREFPTPPTPDYELRAMEVPGLTDESGICAYFWVRKDAAGPLSARGIVAAAESARWSKAPVAPSADDAFKTARQKSREEEIAAELAELDQPRPPEPPTIDPPLPPPATTPTFATQRLGAADPSTDEPRFSIADVTRPLWHDDVNAPFELLGTPGSYLEFEVASTPPTREEADPQDATKKRLVVTGAAGTRTPKSVEVRLKRGSEFVALPTRLVAPAADGTPAWRRVRAELAGAPTGSAELDVVIDGVAAHASGARRWFVTVPRLHQQVEESARPNVVVITIDTLRADYLGCYGHDRPTSPNLDTLAKQSVLFERNLSQASWTLPSYSSVFSGQYVEAHGVVHRNHKFRGHFVTWIEKLAAAGYAVGGAVSGTFTDAYWGFDQGFDSYDDLGMVVNEGNLDATLAASGLAPDNPEAMKTAAHRRLTSPEIANKAIAFLDEHRDRRFLLFAHFFDPHEDYVKHPDLAPQFPDRAPPKGFPNGVDRRPEVTARMRSLYEAEIAYTDRHVARVLRRLDELGLASNTIVVLFSDHGEAFKEHILDPSADGDKKNVGHGSSLFNEQVHVPLLFRVPGIEPGRVATPTGNLDIGPTLLELCGVDPGEWIHHGRSLVELMRDKSGDPERRVFAAQFFALPRKGEEPGTRTQAIHRVDQDELAAIEYEALNGQQGQRFLFSWKERWQDYAKNLAKTMAGELEALSRYYAARRAELEKLAPKAETVDTEGVGKTLAELGYTGE